MAETKNKTTKVAPKKTVTEKKTVAKKVLKEEIKKTPVKKAVAKKTEEKKVAPKKTPVKKTAVKKTIKVEDKKVTPKKEVTKKAVKRTNIFTSFIHNLNFIKRVFADIFLLFSNFIHWNISKLIIFVWSIILAFIAISPLIGIFFIYSFFSEVDVNSLINGMFNGTLLYNVYGNILLILMIFIYFIVFSYSNVLLFKLNNSYKDGKKLSFKKNDYFKVKKIVKFFNLSLVNILILLVPFLGFAILMGVLFIVSGGVDNISSLVAGGIFNYFSILSFIFLIISGIALIYLYYRVIFSYLVFSDDKIYSDKKSVIYYVKESFKKTKKIKKFLKFIVIILIFTLLVSPINYFGKILDNNSKYLNDFIVYTSLTDEQKNNIPTTDLYYFQALKVEFNGLSTDEVTKKIQLNYIYITLFSILNFVFLYGLFAMIFSSFYRRELV